MCLTAIQKKPLCVVTMLSKVIEAGSVDYVKFFSFFGTIHCSCQPVLKHLLQLTIYFFIFAELLLLFRDTSCLICPCLPQ